MVNPVRKEVVKQSWVKPLLTDRREVSLTGMVEWRTWAKRINHNQDALRPNLQNDLFSILESCSASASFYSSCFQILQKISYQVLRCIEPEPELSLNSEDLLSWRNESMLQDSGLLWIITLDFALAIGLNLCTETTKYSVKLREGYLYRVSYLGGSS